jgi:putative oligomerization/nucleic acid binding protein
MKFKTSTLVWTFVWCWFMGVTAISIGFGALFPSMNLVAKPFVCPNGKMDLTKEVYNPYPGNTIITLTWYCLDEASGAKTELGIFPMSLYAGTIYGWLFFGLVVVGMMIVANRRQKIGDEVQRTPVHTVFETASFKPRYSETILARMKELKELRAANLISEVEYEEKRAEILKSL